MAALRAKDYIRVTQETDVSHRFAHNVYEIVMEPCPKKPDTEKSDTVEPCPEKPCTEKPAPNSIISQHEEDEGGAHQITMPPLTTQPTESRPVDADKSTATRSRNDEWTPGVLIARVAAVVPRGMSLDFATAERLVMIHGPEDLDPALGVL
jgi:hypothetical protein